jgi:predicted nucleotidyltransferase
VRTGLLGTAIVSERAMTLGAFKVDEGQIAQICRCYLVRELSVFGSAARGAMRSDSDIDLLVDFLPGAGPGLLDHAGLMIELSELLERKVDLVSKNGLKPLIRDSVTRESRRLYAA